MASATTRPTFSFHLSSSSPPKPTPNLPFPPLLLSSKSHSLSATIRKHPPNLNIFTAKSIDVSKEDKPISEQAPHNPETPPASDDYPPQQQELPFDEKRRLEEKFAVLNTGIYECKSCGYKYDEAAGDPAYPVPPGMQFSKLPEDWRCPTCGAAKTFFESKSVEIAGFAQNQQFGLGGNTLTSGQKAVLIYGGLLLSFALFLSDECHKRNVILPLVSNGVLINSLILRTVDGLNCSCSTNRSLKPPPILSALNASPAAEHLAVILLGRNLL
ncbi:hypothetical protein RHSIM_Rhsim07G0175800 [Rhododendron simsii]|uniref:Rubredoxin-like domain-containing protein n=1 Tax=Rhododendron simsii TaxID=118357 RepID=A0A834GQW7_RHOSS|nr:hypothetical protein RHSIM_Rhsim07G0175800 [Rhododendron simsii]